MTRIRGLTTAVLAILVGALSVGDRALQAQRADTGAPAGMVRIGVLKNGTYDVVTLPIEVYVARVLGGEAAPDSAPAALETLAVAIRTYTVTNLGRHRQDGFDLCDQTHCQVMRTSSLATERAALATAEQILLADGSPATVYYSASCGGRSEKPSNVWPGADDPSYLAVHDDDGCGGFPQWTAELARTDLQRALAAGGYKGSLRDVRILSRNESGRVARLALDGLTPGEITGQDLRMVVGRTLGFQHLQSAAFELRRSGQAFRFTGRGAGHGVGLCVIGSMKLAAKGQSAGEILARYFPGTRLGSYGARLTAAPPTVAPRITEALPPPSGRAVPAPFPGAGGRAAAGGGARTTASPPGAGPSSVAAAGAMSGGAAAPSAVASSATSGAAAVPPAGREPGVASTARATAAGADAPARSGVTVSGAGVEGSERARLVALIAEERDRMAERLGVPASPVSVRVHPTRDAFERWTAMPWFALGAVVAGEVHLVPLSILQERGMTEQAIRHQLVHVMADQSLPARPAWVREGAAVYFSTPEAPSAPPVCPQDPELQQPVSIGALADAYGRARRCFERQLGTGRDWRRVR